MRQESETGVAPPSNTTEAPGKCGTTCFTVASQGVRNRRQPLTPARARQSPESRDSRRCLGEASTACFRSRPSAVGPADRPRVTGKRWAWQVVPSTARMSTGLRGQIQASAEAVRIWRCLAPATHRSLVSSPQRTHRCCKRSRAGRVAAREVPSWPPSNRPLRRRRHQARLGSAVHRSATAAADVPQRIRPRRAETPP